MQYDKIKLAVGIFVIVLLGVILSSLYFLVKAKGLFDERYTYNFTISSAESFSVGMPLKFSGFNIGVIDNISLKDDGSVKIIFSVDEENKKWIREDTFLTIKKPLIGSAYIVIDSKLDKPLLAAGSTLRITQSDDINDMISKLEPVVQKIIKIIDSIDTITANLASEDSELAKILRNLEKFSGKLANDDSLLTSITGDKNTSKILINSLTKLDNSIKDVNAITKDFSNISSTLGKDIVEPASSAAKELNEIMKDVRKKLQAIDGTVNAVGGYEKDLTQVKEQISVAIQKSNEIISKVDNLLQDDAQKEVILP